MKEMIKMVVVLTLLSSLSGGLLAYVKDRNQGTIESQVVKFVKGPPWPDFRGRLQRSHQRSLRHRRGGQPKRDFFVAKYRRQVKAVAFEATGKGGYGGDVGLLVAVDVASDQIFGVGVTTHSETAGLGPRPRPIPSSPRSSRENPHSKPFSVSGGRSINAMSGAPSPPRRCASAATEAVEVYKRLKPEIEKNSKGFK
jgi:electron transport complex protein RnfG